ncbi:hypothetical protein WJX72_004094 [[Myrmecia] bisecta]|uniref:Inositol-1-monophosphatase n=1 Tax=[Myrmecia] bisecta TaxID=41462 RepID=A0AAW1QEW0_9CHLO
MAGCTPVASSFQAAQPASDYAGLLHAAEQAAAAGAKVVWEAADKPRNIMYKGTTDLVTETDKKSEEEILQVLTSKFADHAFLGEEGGVSGNPDSPYLWCVDPLDGTTNFTHSYPSFGVSVGVLHQGQPVAAVVVEFSGGPGTWVTRTYTASKGGGSYCNGQRIHVSSAEQLERSLLVTGFGYEHDAAWATNIELFKHFTDKSQGVRRLGAAAVDLCHVACGLVDAYWEFSIKPWDVTAGVLLVTEAGGVVTTLEGKPYTVFDRSIVAAGPTLHGHILDVTKGPTQQLRKQGQDLSPWFVPKGYKLPES